MILFDYLSNIIYTVTRKEVVPMKLNAKFIKKIKNLPIKYILPMLLVMALFVVALPGPMALSAATATPAATAIYNGLGAEDATQGPATIGLNITGQIPTAQTGNSRLNNELEEIWEAQRNAFIQNHMAGALSIHSDAQHFTSYRFVSTVFIKEAVSVSTTAAVSTTVIDSETNQIITLPDFNPNILQLINNHINSLMADGSSNFSGIDANHPFYLDNDRLVIPFGSAELIPTERGIHEIVLSISNIESKSFSSDHFRVLPASQYNTIMIRLSDVMESFGYTVEWYGDARAAVVYLDGITEVS